MKYSQDDLKEAVQKSFSYANVLRILNIKQAGGSHSYIVSKIKRLGLDTSHFTGQAHNKAKKSINKKTFLDILIVLPEGSMRPKVSQLRRALGECGIETKCVRCELTDSWNGIFIQLEVDHVNDDWLDNRLSNLQYLCPNCHSQKKKSLRSPMAGGD